MTFVYTCTTYNKKNNDSYEMMTELFSYEEKDKENLQITDNDIYLKVYHGILKNPL